MGIRPHKGTEADKKKETKPAKKVAKHAPRSKSGETDQSAPRLTKAEVQANKKRK